MQTFGRQLERPEAQRAKLVRSRDRRNASPSTPTSVSCIAHRQTLREIQQEEMTRKQRIRTVILSSSPRTSLCSPRSVHLRLLEVVSHDIVRTQADTWCVGRRA
ncbi:hypothetical protein L227DRAFT_300745 [Lentinus tigrinus ALCF2SS1-6]|uniref:Uncharacterized protein n=1 Tax=Lentinus tigrinus ALCF2SS1-6 TaxID=1328759 RepID=A0A5C2RXG4_9APHY|nr:hypothetical protein L227DRAFT_300745 [Lentinus tigrinus ALCF2SS1-6]